VLLPCRRPRFFYFGGCRTVRLKRTVDLITCACLSFTFSPLPSHDSHSASIFKHSTNAFFLLRVQYTGPGGKPFYFNEETGFFQWERPVGVGSFAEGDPPPGSGANPASNNDTANGGGATSGGGSSPGGGNNGEEEYGDEAWAYTDADATGNGGGGNGGGGYEWQGGGGGGPAEPIGPWAQYPDEEGYYYWYNHGTGASSWDPPNADGGSNGKDEGDGDEYNWDPNETYEGGYWDEQGEWVDTTGEEGYYEGYYDEAGEWVQYEED